jgi:hypothetical protein
MESENNIKKLSAANLRWFRSHYFYRGMPTKQGVAILAKLVRSGTYNYHFQQPKVKQRLVDWLSFSEEGKQIVKQLKQEEKMRQTHLVFDEVVQGGA